VAGRAAGRSAPTPRGGAQPLLERRATRLQDQPLLEPGEASDSQASSRPAAPCPAWRPGRPHRLRCVSHSASEPMTPSCGPAATRWTISSSNLAMSRASPSVGRTSSTSARVEPEPLHARGVEPAGAGSHSGTGRDGRRDPVQQLRRAQELPGAKAACRARCQAASVNQPRPHARNIRPPGRWSKDQRALHIGLRQPGEQAIGGREQAEKATGQHRRGVLEGRREAQHQVDPGVHISDP